MRRMDRYMDNPDIKEKRTNLNQDLYQNVNNNTKYTNITDVTNANAYEINNTQYPSKTREDYQKMIKYTDVEKVPKSKKELDDFNYIYKTDHKKVYDINSVLEEARKNRQEQDALEEKRKLKNTSYNILAGLNLEELEKYREEKKKRIMTPEEEEMREIIDTIATKTLAGEIDKETTVDLLSDLMATNMMDRVESQNENKEITQEIHIKTTEIEKIDDNESNTEKISKENIKLEEIEKVNNETPVEEKNEAMKDTDTEFYSKSMDLSENDLEMDDEFVDAKLPLWVKILIFILVLIITAIAGYFIIQRIR